MLNCSFNYKLYKNKIFDVNAYKFTLLVKLSEIIFYISLYNSYDFKNIFKFLHLLSSSFNSLIVSLNLFIGTYNHDIYLEFIIFLMTFKILNYY